MYDIIPVVTKDKKQILHNVRQFYNIEIIWTTERSVLVNVPRWGKTEPALWQIEQASTMFTRRQC